MNYFFPKQSPFFEDLNKLNAHLQAIVGLFSDFAKDFNDFEGYAKKAITIIAVPRKKPNARKSIYEKNFWRKVFQ